MICSIIHLSILSSIHDHLVNTFSVLHTALGTADRTHRLNSSLTGPFLWLGRWTSSPRTTKHMGRAIIKVCITCYESTELRELFLIKGLVRRRSKKDSPIRDWVWKNSQISPSRKEQKRHSKCLKHQNMKEEKFGKPSRGFCGGAWYVMVKSSGFILWWRVRGGFWAEQNWGQFSVSTRSPGEDVENGLEGNTLEEEWPSRRLLQCCRAKWQGPESALGKQRAGAE